MDLTASISINTYSDSIASISDFETSSPAAT